jgi:hypothetical protein
VLEQTKGQMIEKHGHQLVIYIGFWGILTFFGTLFFEFYRMNNITQLSRLMEILNYGLIYPAAFLYLVFFALVLAMSSSYLVFYAIVAMGGVPFLCFIIPYWWGKLKPVIKSSITGIVK